MIRWMKPTPKMIEDALKGGQGRKASEVVRDAHSFLIMMITVGAVATTALLILVMKGAP